MQLLSVCIQLFTATPQKIKIEKKTENALAISSSLPRLMYITLDPVHAFSAVDSMSPTKYT